MVDLIRTYADRTHHGKEEEILFRDLSTKRIPDELAKIMNELIEEHKTARATVKKLVDAKEKYLEGDSSSVPVILACLKMLTEFYPKHIEKRTGTFSSRLWNISRMMNRKRCFGSSMSSTGG